MSSPHRKLRELEALLSEARVKEEIVEKKGKKNALIFKITQEIRASGALHQEPGLEANIPFSVMLYISHHLQLQTCIS